MTAATSCPRSVWAGTSRLRRGPTPSPTKGPRTLREVVRDKEGRGFVDHSLLRTRSCVGAKYLFRNSNSTLIFETTRTKAAKVADKEWSSLLCELVLIRCVSPPRAARPWWDARFNHGSSPLFITCTSAQVRIFPTDDNLEQFKREVSTL